MASTETARPSTGPLQFLSEVGEEGRRVTWPTRRETVVTTAMVFAMTAAATAFLSVVDLAMRALVGAVLGLGA